MKVIAAAFAALVLAGPASAQMPRSNNPPPPPADWTATSPDYDGIGGPQWRWMTEHGYTITDTLPYSGSDALSDQLNNSGFGESAPPYPPPAPPYPPPAPY